MIKYLGESNALQCMLICNTYHMTETVQAASPVSCGCRIHRLHLCTGVRPPPNECHGFDIKPSDGKAPALEIWGMWSTPSLQLLPGPL